MNKFIVAHVATARRANNTAVQLKRSGAPFHYVLQARALRDASMRAARTEKKG